MPSRVDFYVLRSTEPGAHLVAACRVVEKAWRNNHRIFVHTQNAAGADELDRLLWTFRQGSFVPHSVAQSATPAEGNEVVIGSGQLPETQFDVLVNVSEELPAFYPSFPRVAEFVPASPESKSAARERYRTYRGDGCEIQSHNV